MDGDFDSPAVASHYGQEMVGDLGYMVPKLVLASEDLSAATESQAKFGLLVAEWKQRTRYLTSPSLLVGLQVQELWFASEDVNSTAGIREEFERLAAEWKDDTAYLSSPSMIAKHRAYQEIIGMGKEAIPLILRDLEESRAQWFWALRSIARESPVTPEDRGDVDAMTAAWLDWGKSRQYI